MKMRGLERNFMVDVGRMRLANIMQFYSQPRLEKIVGAQKTRLDAQLVRVHLDNELHVDCTPDHKFMLRDGTYKEAQHLKVNESLMPFYSKVHNKKHEMPGYEMIYNPAQNSYVYAHRLTFMPKWQKGYVIHHKDFNPLNNDPDNLERMTSKTHKKLHDKNLTPELIKSRAEGLKNYYKTHVKTVGDIPTIGRTLEEIYGVERAQEIKDSISKNQIAWLKDKTLENCPKLVELSNKHSIRLKKFFKTDEGKKVLQGISETRKKRIASGEIVVLSGEDHPSFGKTWEELYTSEDIKNRKEKIVAANKARTIVKVFRTVVCGCGCGEQFKVDSRYPKLFVLGHHNKMRGYKKTGTYANHKVVRVEWLSERSDTYDITVEKNHNFSLSCGIFVHNSVEDLFIPVWGDVNDVMIEEIGGKTDIRWIVDVEELRNQLASALRCPLALLGGYVQEASGQLGSEAISQLDIRFARSSRRLQRALIEGITRLCQIHLAYQNMDPDPSLFEIHMSETSTAEEQQVMESLDTSVDVIVKFVEMLDAVTEGTNQQFDKIEVVNYFNQKLLRLGDFDLKSYLKEKEVEVLPPEETGGLSSSGGRMPKVEPESHYIPPTEEAGITGEPGEEEMVIPPMESRAAVLHEAVKMLEKKKRQAPNSGKITSNLDYIAALPLEEVKSKFKPGAEWTKLYENVKVRVGEKSGSQKSKSNEDSKKSKSSKKS